MDIHFGFAPDAARARRIDQRMHAELGASLRHLCDASRGIVPFDERDMGRLIESLDGDACYAPLVFGDYYALGAALFEDEHSAAAEVFERLRQARPIPREQVIGALEDVDRCPKSAAYQRMMTGEAGTDIGILPPADDVARAFMDRYRRGMALMEQAMPELAGEVRAIVHEVVCVAGDPSKKMQFDGGSHFQLWGALFLNVDHHRTEHAIVEVVAHESAHSLLFGFCTDEPLVYNDDEDLYPSPLRADLRPMDGIYHATFVSARMHWAMSRLIESGLLSDEARTEALNARKSDQAHFEAGHRVIAESGELSAVGAALMASARAYMDAVAE